MIRRDAEQPDREAEAPFLPPPPPGILDERQDLYAAEVAALARETKQAEYRRQFQLQINRRGCPGCCD